MYNKNYCSAAQNSSFWKRFLVRLLLQKKARWKKMGLTAVVLLQPPEKSTHNSVGQRHTCPLQQQSKRSSRNCYEAFFFLSASWHGHEAGSQEFTHRVSVCLTEHREKKEKSLLYNREICWEWSTATAGARAKQKHERGPKLSAKPCLSGWGGGGGETRWRPRRPRNLSHLSASVMSSFFVEIERHATASVTQIFYITHCVTEIIEPR